MFRFWCLSVFKKNVHRVKWSICIRTNEGCNTSELQTRKEINYFVSWRVRRITAPNGSLRHCFFLVTNLPGIISFLVKNIAVGMIVSTSGLEMPGLQGNFKFADANDGLQKWILVLSPSKVSQFWIEGSNLYNWHWHNETWTLVLNLSASSFVKNSKPYRVLLQKWTTLFWNEQSHADTAWKMVERQLCLQGMKLKSVLQNCFH